jgi:predicted peptidase
MKKIFSSRRMLIGIVALPLCTLLIALFAFSGKHHKSQFVGQNDRDFFKAIVYCRAADNIMEEVPELARQAYYYSALDAASRSVLFDIQDNVLDNIEKRDPVYFARFKQAIIAQKDPSKIFDVIRKALGDLKVENYQLGLSSDKQDAAKGLNKLAMELALRKFHNPSFIPNLNFRAYSSDNYSHQRDIYPCGLIAYCDVVVQPVYPFLVIYIAEAGAGSTGTAYRLQKEKLAEEIAELVS